MKNYDHPIVYEKILNDYRPIWDAIILENEGLDEFKTREENGKDTHS